MTSKSEALIRGLFAKDEHGHMFIRVVAASPKKLTNAVNTQSNRSLESLLNNAIVLDKDGNPALCLAEVQYGMTYGEREKQKRVEATKALETSTDEVEETSTDEVEEPEAPKKTAKKSAKKS